MALDPKLREAITEATFEMRQDEGLATKLIAWLDALTAGNERLEDRDSVQRHIELLYEATQVGDE